jgi:hypothetical protein
MKQRIINSLYIIGNTQGCFIFYKGKTIEQVQLNIVSLRTILNEENFVQINSYTLINTIHLVGFETRSLIKMTDGSLHKIYRRQKKNFKISTCGKGAE